MPKEIKISFFKNLLRVSVELSSTMVVYISRGKDANFDVRQVIKCAEKLKCGKSDGDIGFMSDHIKLAPHIFYVYLTMLYNAIVCHGHVPELMLKGTITHIPKDLNGKFSDSSNYRGIVLCICLCKVFEDLIVTVNHDVLCTSDLQFAYKKGHSTNGATLTLKEVLRYYKTRRTMVYGCSLDASKAFDRVKHDKLFELLYKRGLPPIILRTVIFMYEGQQSRCRYFSSFSSYYSICNGIRQGGVASPILFLVYMDELYQRLILAGFGLYIGTVFVGILGYADDILLLAATLSTLNDMLKVCEIFGKEFDIMYNPGKSKCIVFNVNKHLDSGLSASMYGRCIPRVTKLPFLGNLISSDCSDGHDVESKCADLNARSNSLVHTLFNLSRNVKCKLFLSKCAHGYGAETWDMSRNESNVYFKAVGQAARRVLGLPPCCPSLIVNALFDCDVTKCHTYQKAVSLIESFRTSDNEIMQMIYSNAMADPNSYIRRNLYCITKTWGSLVKPAFSKVITPELTGITELLDVREKNALLELDSDDVDNLIMLLCMR